MNPKPGPCVIPASWQADLAYNPDLSGHGVGDELRVGSERRNPTGDPINFSQLEDRHHVFDLANMLPDAIRLVGAQLICERRVRPIDFAVLCRGIGISSP